MADRSYTASEAAMVTGVSDATARDWRRRGLLKAGGGRWIRYTRRDLVHLRMTAALLEAGIPVSAAIPHAKELEDSLASQVVAAQYPDAGYANFAAVIARRPDGDWYRSVETNLDYVRDLQTVDASGRTTFGFTTIVIVNLGPIAADMAAKLADLPASTPTAEE